MAVSKPKAANTTLSPGKRRAFMAIAVAIPVLIFVFLEIGLRIGGYGGDQSLFKRSAGFGGGALYVPNPNFASRYFVNIKLVPTPSRDAFLVEKPDNSLRLFVLGESTTAGYPYGFNGMFSRVVRDALGDVLPSDTVEVINVATSAINSYTVFDQVGDILKYEPDGILIYLGHNEFYGALGIASTESLGAFPGFVRFYLKLQQMRTFLLLRDVMGSFMSLFSTNTGSGTLMQQVVREQIIPFKSQTYDMGKRQFESNLSVILSRFKDAKVPVYISSVTSNIVDQPPFESIATDSMPAADEVFRHAQERLADGDTSAAVPLFKQARDLDALRFRATDEFNGVIRDAAQKYGAVYVPVAEAFEEASPGGLIGYNLMLEHLHPNDTGYHLMGRVFFETIAANGYFGRNPSPEKLDSWENYRHRMYLSDFDQRSVWHRLKLLMQAWPFVKEQSSDYRRSYVVSGTIDSTAFQFVNGDVSWERAKVALGTWYENTGQTELALTEYYGLMRDQPHNDSPMLFSARILLDRGDYTRALPLLERAYEISPSAYGTKMLGALEVDRGNLDRGIELLEKSLTLKSDDAQTTFNLSGAYALNGNIEKARELATRTESLNPRFPGLREWKSQLGMSQ